MTAGSEKIVAGLEAEYISSSGSHEGTSIAVCHGRSASPNRKRLGSGGSGLRSIVLCRRAGGIFLRRCGTE
jgi:hypothetical protein